ncbi:death-associated protein kinase 1 [Agrilus planipennis]|uniref:Death-associated protein kinase 1 n=1 Tax=Agrilus planipennis TaxID=224129 RepID=A0A1W4X156_AGRPL|nr:death-associated protein kinase 1 [Agrilus planipennis]
MHTCISRGSSYSPSGSIEYTPLQLAAKEGNYEEVEFLLESEENPLDTGPDPALHLALRKGHVEIAFRLLEKGANFEIRDSYGDYPIHIACAKGLLNIVEKLSSLGCNLEKPNSKGLFPLHLAAKKGHIHIVRYLCVVGCNIDARNADNIRADITALKYGHQDIADLLDRLRHSGQRDHYVRQLVPTTKPAFRLILRVLGHCAVGKTAFIKSLHAGLFSSLFKRSSSLQSNKSRPSSPITTQIEMDVTSRHNSLTFEPPIHYHSTKGIHIQNIDISGVGDVTVLEFSGQENYFPVYHNFLSPSPNVLTVILFNLEDSPLVQIQQVCFWINFILARQPADLLPSSYGKVHLVATHVDLTRTPKNQNGEWISTDAQKTLEAVKKLIPHVYNLDPNVLIVDCTAPACHGFKQFKALLASLKHASSTLSVGNWTGLMESIVTLLGNLRKGFEQFPVLFKDDIYEIIRNDVNPLASDDHIEDALLQLHKMGEVFYTGDLVVVCLTWLGKNLIGELLSNEFISNARTTGVYTADDFQACFTECDALGTIQLMESLHLCVQCLVDDDVEYEFPIYNQTETLPGLWDAHDPRYKSDETIYGGIQLHTPPNTLHLLFSVFSHIQVELRKATLNNQSIDNETDLYQWFRGSKLSTDNFETMITLNKPQIPSEFIEVKIRGSESFTSDVFHFFNQVLEIIDQAILIVCPGIIIEKHVLSPHELCIHCPDPYVYDPADIFAATLDAESVLDIALYNPNIDIHESITSLIMFGDADLANEIEWGCTLKINALPAPVKLKVCGLLDPPEPQGKDWCLLAFRLGLESEVIASLDLPHTSRTMRLLNAVDCTIGALIANLHDLGRKDVADVVLRSAPLVHLVKNSSLLD